MGAPFDGRDTRIISGFRVQLWFGVHKNALTTPFLAPPTVPLQAFADQVPHERAERRRQRQLRIGILTADYHGLVTYPRVRVRRHVAVGPHGQVTGGRSDQCFHVLPLSKRHVAE